jgi:DNA-binding response OmpR family regulator
MLNESTQTAADGPIPGQSVQKLLIVEDNLTMARAMSSLIKRAGYEPILFHQGAPALTYIATQTPVAAILDIHLPDFSGLVLSQKLRERFGPNFPIVILSGDTSMETLNSLRHVGATYFFSKPVNGGHLVERLKEWIGNTQKSEFTSQ